jgi:hypothetical protein
VVEEYTSREHKMESVVEASIINAEHDVDNDDTHAI